MADAIRVLDNALLIADNGLGVDPTCCCLEPCCGRDVPGVNDPPLADDLPTTLYMRITPTDCPCLDTQEIVLTWDPVDFRWEASGITWASCTGYTGGYVYLSCGGTFENPDEIWSLLLGGFGPCVGSSPGAMDGIRANLPCASCDPLDCELCFNIYGLHCCTNNITFPPERQGGTICVEIWE